ncbi:MAG: hypothetical protein LBI05_09070 [Planctomycetaceae bacterium]|jgi:hypothetical protein|nr:hypothetical protein [Planctomycetaceae bacterium]
MRVGMMFLVVLAAIGVTGCRERSVTPPEKSQQDSPSNVSPITTNSLDPYPILDRMVAAYQNAASYSDIASAQIIGKMSQPGAEPVPRICSVVFQKPNKLHIQVSDGTIVSDGEDCYAQIRPLPQQMLHFPAPEQWTLDTLFQDVHLDHAMELGLPLSVVRFPPQLVLLFANDPLNTFCPKGAKVEWAGRQQIGQISCDVIRIIHSDGNRILWISRENKALLRLDYQPVGLPVPKGYESIEAIRIEMTNAKFDWLISDDSFYLPQPPDAVQVTEFQSDMPGLPTPAEHQRLLTLMADTDCYRLIDHHEEAITSPPLSKVEPNTFTLSPAWSLPLTGVDTMVFLSGETPKLLVPHEGNLVAELDLQGNILKRVAPLGLEDSIITNIHCSFPFGKQRTGILTLDNRFYLFDEFFQSLEDHKKEKVRNFQFVPLQGEELLLLNIQQDAGQENIPANGLLRAVDLQSATRWEYPFEGIFDQIIVGQDQVWVSCTASNDSIFVLSTEGKLCDSVAIPSARHVLWFHVLDSTIYTLLENMDTGDIRFVGFDQQGKNHWSRLLPAGEYEVDPVYISNDKKWLVPSPVGEFFVFDLIGNIIDTFSLNIIPTGLLCACVNGETLLIVADGETVSAWKFEKK